MYRQTPGALICYKIVFLEEHNKAFVDCFNCARLFFSIIVRASDYLFKKILGSEISCFVLGRLKNTVKKVVLNLDLNLVILT